jgi:hypothetical protein
MGLVILAFDDDWATQPPKKVAIRYWLLNPGINRSISSKGWRHMRTCPMDFSKRIADELLKAVFPLGKLLRPLPA